MLKPSQRSLIIRKREATKERKRESETAQGLLINLKPMDGRTDRSYSQINCLLGTRKAAPSERNYLNSVCELRALMDPPAAAQLQTQPISTVSTVFTAPNAAIPILSTRSATVTHCLS